MNRRAPFSALALFCIVLTGCATPGAVKGASAIQLEAFSSAQQSVDSYVDLVDKEVASMQALRVASLELTAVVTAVEKAVADADTGADPVAAVDALSGAIAAGRQAAASAPDSLQAIAGQHRENMAHLHSLLELLEENQRLIDLYLNTDLGPSQAQVDKLGAELQSLMQLGGAK